MSRRYRWIDDDGDGARRRVLVVTRRGFDGFIVRWTDFCSGCTDYGDYGTRYGPVGCEECGYTGKRRRSEWIPCDPAAWFRYLDRIHARHDRFCAFVRSHAPNGAA